MGAVVFPVVAVFLAVALWNRLNGGISILATGYSLDFWSAMVQETPSLDWKIILRENVTLWFFVYMVAYILIHMEPTSSFFFSFKFNPRYPKRSLVFREFLRSLRGVIICSTLELLSSYLYIKNMAPIDKLCPSIVCETSANNLGLVTLSVLFSLIYLWGDMHFYWTHRLLHTKWLYRQVHKEHHESYNPDPWSGLSMHWVESTIYFSAAFLAAAVAPFWIVRLMYKALIVFPLEGHSGHGTWKIEGSHNHYIHHAKFNWNYGSSPLWDHIMGTAFVNDKQNSNSRSKGAAEQAALVGSQITGDLKGIAVPVDE